MKKLSNYLVRNLSWLIVSIIISNIIAFFIFPWIINFEFARIILSQTTKGIFILITLLILLFFILFWSKAKKLWKRYKNTYKLEKPPFIYLDGIFLVIVLDILLIALFQKQSIPNLSLEFIIFISFNSILLLVWFLSILFCEIKKDEEEYLDKDKYALSDEPIQFADQDLLGREKFIDDLYREILNLPFTESFVFGLYGGWGEGKTSVINLLRNKFNSNEHFIIVNYNPWQYKDEKAILSSFYKQVERAISQKFILPGIKSAFIKYQKIISLGIPLTAIKFDIRLKEKDLQEIKQMIESFIIQTNKKILFFIDDIDRLQSHDIFLIFKLVRLNANFKNTIFILSFDQNVIKDYLKENASADPEFLDKIVQKPVQLPAIEQIEIDNFLNFHINKLFDEIKITQEEIEIFQKDFPYIYQSKIAKLFKTLRHAKRYLNGLRSTLPPIKNEINLHDFIILEVIRIFYPKVYNDIWRNPWFYIPIHWSVAYFLISPFSFVANHEEKNIQIKNHIDDITKNEKENDVLIELLKDIFFVEVKNALNMTRTEHSHSAEYYRAEKRITHPGSFKKYFTLKVSSLEIPDEFVDIILNSWHSTEKNNVESVIEKTILELQKKDILLEIFKKLLIFKDKLQQEIVPYIVKVIYKNVEKFSKKGTEDLWNSEYDYAQSLLLWLINDKIKRTEIQSILEEVITKIKDLTFDVHIILSCKRERGGSFYKIYDSIRIEELQNILSDRLKKYFVDENRDIFEELEELDWGFVLYQWATNWMTFTGENKKIVNEYILSLCKENAKKFVRFIMHYGKRTRTDTLTYDLDKLGKAYNIKELKNLAETFNHDSSLSTEERKSIESFLDIYNKEFPRDKNM